MEDLHYSTCTYKYTIWLPIQDDLKYRNPFQGSKLRLTGRQCD